MEERFDNEDTSEGSSGSLGASAEDGGRPTPASPRIEDDAPGFTAPSSRADAQGWISVNDRLPGLWEKVLVYVGAWNHQDVHFGWIKDPRTGEWEVLDERGNHTAFLTHWMPLPKKPHTNPHQR